MEDKPLPNIENKTPTQIRKAIKALALTLELLAIGLVVYLVFAPIYPAAEYDWQKIEHQVDDKIFQNATSTIEATNKIINQVWIISVIFIKSIANI